jgi:hypothetical protein
MAKKAKRKVARKPARNKATKNIKGRGDSVRVGLHGLGKILRAIHSAPGTVQKDFEKKMGRAHVELNPKTAAMIKAFAKDKLPGHPVTAEMFQEPCDCDPVTDPFCICFGNR